MTQANLTETSKTVQTVGKRTRRIAGGRLRVGTIAGFPIFLHWSLLFLALPLALYWSNVVSFLKITAALFVSVIMHEVAHAAAARLLKFGKGSITVWVLGGYFIPYQMEHLPFEMEKDNRLKYIVMVLAGPLSNCLMAILMYLVYLFTRSEFILLFANMNFSLAFLNSLPFPPLDGGQVLVTFSSFYFKRRPIYIALLICFLIAMVGYFIAPSSFFDLPDELPSSIGLLGFGIGWSIRMISKSDEEFINEWKNGIKQERLMMEEVYYRISIPNPDSRYNR